jgi:hypothetical protein
MQNTTKQGIRLKTFIDDLGMSVDGFRKACNIKSTGTIPSIIKQGSTLTLKTLDKIIQAYPMLNKDWILTGVGDMYIDQFKTHKTVSKAAYTSSQNSAFSKLQQSQDNHDFALNELIIKNNKTNESVTDVMTALNKHVITLSTQISELKKQSDKRTEVVNKAVESLLGGVSHLINHMESYSNKWEEMALKKEKEIGSSFDREKKEHIKLIKSLDKERKKLLENTLQKYYITGLKNITTSLLQELTTREGEITKKVIDLIRHELGKQKVVTEKNLEKIGKYSVASKTKL